MAYSTSAPPVKIVAGSLDGTAGPSVWSYVSSDSDATVKAANYFSNGSALGMVVGDIVFVYNWTTAVGTSPLIYIHYVSSVTAGGAASLNQTPSALS